MAWWIVTCDITLCVCYSFQLQEAASIEIITAANGQLRAIAILTLGTWNLIAEKAVDSATG